MNGENVSIIQPVLGWNRDYPSAWSIASWNCCVTGTVFEAAPAWLYVRYMFSGNTVLSNVGHRHLGFDIGEVLRAAKYLKFRADLQLGFCRRAGSLQRRPVRRLPPNGSISFHDLGLYDYRGIPIASPAWSVLDAAELAQEKGEPFSQLTPQCGYGGSLPQQVTLTY